MYQTLYRLASGVLEPLLPLYLRWRVRLGKEDPLRVRERFGHASMPRPNTPLIWIHAASMGESQSVLPLIERWLGAHPQLHILLTTVTVTSARHVASKLGERAFHQFAPLDTPRAVRRFLNYWRPDMACFVDSELWPNIILSTKKRGVPLVLVNGRISEHSARRWQSARTLCEALLASFTHIFAKSEEDAARFASLGGGQAVSYGNLKFSSPPLPYDPRLMGELVSAIGGRQVWLAASTHDGEEAVIGSIHARLRESFDGLLSIIVPRHSQRGDAIRQELEQQGLRVAQRSRGEALHPSTDVYVADTMGELGMFYRLASIVFIGGSLVPHGGQNPMEAARLDCAILYGPHMHNFREFCAELERHGAAMPLADAQRLEEALSTLMRDAQAQDRMAQAALDVVERNRHVIDHIDQALASLMQEILRKGGSAASARS